MEVIVGILQFIGWIFTIICVIFSLWFILTFIKNLKVEINNIENKDRDVDPMSLGQNMIVYVEQSENNMLHMYDLMSDFFIAQGKDEQELWERAQLRCPGQNLVLTERDGSKARVVTVKAKNQVV